MTVVADPQRQLVVLTGGKFEVDLTWSQALLLGTLLREAFLEVEPATPLGRTYEPTSGRWR